MSFKKQGDPVTVHSLSEANEECSLLIGSFFNHQDGNLCFTATELEPRHEGAPYEVEFDWQKIYDLEDAGTPIIGFFHTHPFQEHIGYSATDDATMKAWCRCFGREMLCIIGNGKELNALYLFDQHGYTAVCARYDLTIGTYQSELTTFMGVFNSES